MHDGALDPVATQQMIRIIMGMNVQPTRLFLTGVLKSEGVIYEEE
jgi:hypothetical protein